MEVVFNNQLFAKIIDYNQQFEKKSTFFSGDEDFIQFAIHQPEHNQKFIPHYHLESARTVLKTQEVLVILSGKMTVTFYSETGDYLGAEDLEGGQAIILLNGAHGFKVHSKDCKFLEIKNGPYLGAELDRKRIEQNND
jgi:mannose-6-phosphate isomerase-like protein (cupin superfamily)